MNNVCAHEHDMAWYGVGLCTWSVTETHVPSWAHVCVVSELRSLSLLHVDSAHGAEMYLSPSAGTSVCGGWWQVKWKIWNLTQLIHHTWQAVESAKKTKTIFKAWFIVTVHNKAGCGLMWLRWNLCVSVKVEILLIFWQIVFPFDVLFLLN